MLDSSGLKDAFGAHAEVRRHAGGIAANPAAGRLRAKWLELAEGETGRAADGYWLTHAAVAMCRWLDDDRSGTEKSLREAELLDPAETALFLVL